MIVLVEILPSARSFDEIQDQVRAYLGHKLRIVMETLTPYVDGTMRPDPELMTVYVTCAKELGKVYRVQQTTPRTDEDMIPISEAEAMIEARVASEVEAAVEQALIEAEARRLEESELSQDEARDAIRRQMKQLTSKQAS